MEALDDLLSESDGELGLSPSKARAGFGGGGGLDGFVGKCRANDLSADRVAPGALPETPADLSLPSKPMSELGLGPLGRYSDQRDLTAAQGLQSGGLRFSDLGDDRFSEEDEWDEEDGEEEDSAKRRTSFGGGDEAYDDEDHIGANDDYGDDYDDDCEDDAEYCRRLLRGELGDLGDLGLEDDGLDAQAHCDSEDAKDEFDDNGDDDDDDDAEDPLYLNMHAEDRSWRPGSRDADRKRLIDDCEEYDDYDDVGDTAISGELGPREQAGGASSSSPSRLGQIKNQARKLLGEFSKVYEDDPMDAYDAAGDAFAGSNHSYSGHVSGRVACEDLDFAPDQPWLRRHVGNNTSPGVDSAATLRDIRAVSAVSKSVALDEDDYGELGRAGKPGSAAQSLRVGERPLRPSPSSAQTTAGGVSESDGEMEADGACRSPSQGSSPRLTPRGSGLGGDVAANMDATPASVSRRGLFEDELRAHSALVTSSTASAGPAAPSLEAESPSRRKEAANNIAAAGSPTCASSSASPSAPVAAANENKTSQSSLPACGALPRPASAGKRPSPVKLGDEHGLNNAAVPSPSVSAAPSPAGSASSQPQPRIFLRKGSRMPRSEIPRSSSKTDIVTKPVVNPAGQRSSLKLQPRAASSEPSAHKEDIGSRVDSELALASASTAKAPIRSRSNGPGDRGAGVVAEQKKLAAQQMAALQQLAAEGSGVAGFSASAVDTWADTAPWDHRGSGLDLDLDWDEPAVPARGFRAQTAAASEALASGPAPFPDEPPTSDVVKSYFPAARGGDASGPEELQHLRTPSAPHNRHSHWEGGDAYSTLYGTGSGVASGPNGRRQDRLVAEHASPRPASGIHADVATNLEQEARNRIAELDKQIKRYEHESEIQKKLQAQADQQQRDLLREREKLMREVEAEKQALRAEFDNERAAMKRERKRLNEAAERQRQQTSEDRETAEERRRMRERNEQLEEETREKDKRWQRTVDRLQRQICELTGKNRELQEEVKRANQQAQQAMETGTKRSSSVTSARGRRPSTGGTSVGSAGGAPQSSVAPQSQGANSRPSSTAARALGAFSGSNAGIETSRPSAAARENSRSAMARDPAKKFGNAPDSQPQFGFAENVSHDSGYRGAPRDKVGGSSGSSPPSLPGVGSPEAGSQDIQEVRTLDGRTEKVFKDGRREVEFANGLKKVIWTDGRTSVLFQNGDRKEIHQDGVVVYHYRATGAVQTTLPDGEELYHFADGQFERHGGDGSKEIRFPNGTTKKILLDGTEEVRFADGSVRTTPAA